MNIKGIKVRYAEVMTSLSLLKGSVNMNQNNLEKSESCFWNFNSKFELTTFLNFKF